MLTTDAARSHRRLNIQRYPIAITATIAAASICSHSQSREAWMRLFWNTPLRVDKRRYFDSDLCYFALLMLSGQYRVW